MQYFCKYLSIVLAKTSDVTRRWRSGEEVRLPHRLDSPRAARAAISSLTNAEGREGLLIGAHFVSILLDATIAVGQSMAVS